MRSFTLSQSSSHAQVQLWENNRFISSAVLWSAERAAFYLNLFILSILSDFWILRDKLKGLDWEASRTSCVRCCRLVQPCGDPEVSAMLQEDLETPSVLRVTPPPQPGPRQAVEHGRCFRDINVFAQWQREEPLLCASSFTGSQPKILSGH